MKTRRPRKFYFDVEFEGKRYHIDLSSEYATVTEFEERETTTGRFNRLWLEATGKALLRRDHFVIDSAQRDRVILAAGWKLSRSKRWKNMPLVFPKYSYIPVPFKTSYLQHVPFLLKDSIK